jgi:hypothetical protein
MSLSGQASREKCQEYNSMPPEQKLNRTEELTYLSINSATPLKGFIVQVPAFLVVLQSLTMISVQQGVSRCLHYKTFYGSKHYNRGLYCKTYYGCNLRIFITS